MSEQFKKEKKAYSLKLVSDRGQITIDKKIRESCKIEPGSQLLEIQLGKAIILVQTNNIFEEITGKLKDMLLSSGMKKEEILKDLEETSRTNILNKYYPDLGI
jgi:bifunctional DNA-binding transcriptional regulator/antitoxin component of YhaV-PrlF toxin-antitoxin module